MLPVSPTGPRPIMHNNFQYHKCSLPDAPVFLMLREVLADGSTGRVAKTRSVARVDEACHLTRRPGPKAAGLRRSRRGMMRDALERHVTSIRLSAEAQNSRWTPTSPTEYAQSRESRAVNRPARGGGSATGSRQNGRCRRCVPPRWGDATSRTALRQDAVGSPDTG